MYVSNFSFFTPASSFRLCQNPRHMFFLFFLIVRLSLIRVAHFSEKKKIKQRLLVALSFVIPKCRSYLLTPSKARWATSLRHLPSTQWRPDIRLKILESLLSNVGSKLVRTSHIPGITYALHLLWCYYNPTFYVFQACFFS